MPCLENFRTDKCSCSFQIEQVLLFQFLNLHTCRFSLLFFFDSYHNSIFHVCTLVSVRKRAPTEWQTHKINFAPVGGTLGSLFDGFGRHFVYMCVRVSFLLLSHPQFRMLHVPDVDFKFISILSSCYSDVWTLPIGHMDIFLMIFLRFSNKKTHSNLYPQVLLIGIWLPKATLICWILIDLKLEIKFLIYLFG